MSPNMNLPVPTVGVTSGPQYASDINACLLLIDTHNHTSGAGVAIPTAGLDINADLTFNDVSATDLLSVRFTPQLAELAGASDLGCIYVVDEDLYYNDTDGTAVRLTQNGAVAGTPGSIANLVAPASASYVALSEKFLWQSALNTPANMDFGSAILRNDVASGYGLTLAPPTLTADYTITLPLLPASVTKIVNMDTSGTMTAAYTIDNSTLEIAANVIQVKALGITATQLAADAVTTAKILNSNVTAAKVETSINLPGKTVKLDSQMAVCSANTATNGLMMVRGHFSETGSLLTGEGYSVSRTSNPGIYEITFTAAFGDTPSLVASLGNGSGLAGNAAVFSINTTTAVLRTFDDAGNLANRNVMFIAVGPRA